MPSLAAEKKRYFCISDNINADRDVKDVDVGVSRSNSNGNSDSCRFGATDEETDDLRRNIQALLLRRGRGSWRSDM